MARAVKLSAEMDCGALNASELPVQEAGKELRAYLAQVLKMAERLRAAPTPAQRLAKGSKGRLAMTGVAGAYLRTYEFCQSPAWAARLLRRHLFAEMTAGGPWIRPVLRWSASNPAPVHGGPERPERPQGPFWAYPRHDQPICLPSAPGHQPVLRCPRQHYPHPTTPPPSAEMFDQLAVPGGPRNHLPRDGGECEGSPHNEIVSTPASLLRGLCHAGPLTAVAKGNAAKSKAIRCPFYLSAEFPRRPARTLVLRPNAGGGRSHPPCEFSRHPARSSRRLCGTSNWP